MSLEKSNKLMKDQKEQKGFSTALLINFSPFETSFREVGDGAENMRLNTSASAIHGEGTQMIHNLLTSDLLEGMDYGSPCFKHNQSNEDKDDDILLNECDNDSVLHSSEGEHSDDEEIFSNHSDNQEENEANFILKQIGMQKSKLNSNPKLPNENKLIMNSNNNEAGNSNMPNPLSNKPPGYLSYYGSTSKYLTEAFMNRQQNKTDTKYKPDTYPLQGLNNTKEAYNNYMNEMMYQQQMKTYPFGYYNMNMNMNMNMNPQLFPNYKNGNNSNNTDKMYPQMLSPNQHQRIEQVPFQHPGMKNYYPYFSMRKTSVFFPNQQYASSNQNNSNGVAAQKKGTKAEIGAQTGVVTQQPANIAQMNAKKKKKKKEKKAKKNDEYLIEMFGRTGWICDQCNNFNYETRNKCNRCGVPKSPKKVSKLKKKQEFTKKQKEQLQQLQTEDSNGQKMPLVNEKKANDKKRVWICPSCKNLNFSFRVICNRCQLPKDQNAVNANTTNTNSNPNPTTNNIILQPMQSNENSSNTNIKMTNRNNNEMNSNTSNLGQLVMNNNQENDDNYEEDYYDNEKDKKNNYQ